jgi:hypothetical protein
VRRRAIPRLAPASAENSGELVSAAFHARQRRRSRRGEAQSHCCFPYWRPPPPMRTENSNAGTRSPPRGIGTARGGGCSASTRDSKARRRAIFSRMRWLFTDQPLTNAGVVCVMHTGVAMSMTTSLTDAGADATTRPRLAFVPAYGAEHVPRIRPGEEHHARRRAGSAAGGRCGKVHSRMYR